MDPTTQAFLAAVLGAVVAGGAVLAWHISDRQQSTLPAHEDPDALTFELNGIILAANANFVLRSDPAALELARRVVRRRLGVEPSSSQRRSSAAHVAAG